VLVGGSGMAGPTLRIFNHTLTASRKSPAAVYASRNNLVRAAEAADRAAGTLGYRQNESHPDQWLREAL
jgi:hypothetical protein